MNCFKTLAATAALTLVVGLAMMCSAQSGPKPAPAPQAATEGVLTEESLRTMLINLGYTPEESKSTNGTTLFYIKATRGDMSYNPYICLSPSKTKIWAQTSLGDFDANDGARALKMLELNFKIGPSHFVHIPGDKTVYMFSPMDNRGVTPKILKDQIDQLLNNCESTKEVWSVTKPAPTTPVSPK
jgi:hypothetical protein